MLAACGTDSDEPNPAPEDEAIEELELTLGHFVGEDHPVHMWAAEFAESLEAETDGRITVDIFTDAALGGDVELAEGLDTGLADLALLGVAFYSRVPEAQILEYPFLYRDREHFWAAQDGSPGEEIGRYAEEAGLKLLGYAEFGARHITNNQRPIETPDDVANLSIRVPEGPVYIEMAEALDANATPIDFGELYLALQQGAVDGQENPASTIESFSFYEVQEYLSLTEHIYTLLWPTMDLDRFNEMNDAAQAAVLSAGREATERVRQFIVEDEKRLIDTLGERGMQINEVDREAFFFVSDRVAEALQDTVPLELVEEVRAIE